MTAEGRSLEWTKDNDTYRVSLPKVRPSLIDGFCDLGVMRRQDTAFRLLYTARVQWGAVAGDDAESKEYLRLRLVTQPGEKHVVIASFQGRPVEGAIIKGISEKGDPVEAKSDKNGQVELSGVAEGRVGLLGKWVEKAAGAVDGKAYDETRYYATLTVAPAAAPTAKEASPQKPFAMMPEPVNSFGGAVLGDWLYVYSGHIGKMHHYHVDTSSKHFRRLNLKDRSIWEELPPGPPLQGVALVAHDGKLYRVGGMSARNQPGKPNDLVSVADFSRFDPSTRTWTNLPSLPSPRSTHDAVVLDNRLYVVGGWFMQGGDSSNTEFCDDALVFDLSQPDAQWETLPRQPFHHQGAGCRHRWGKDLRPRRFDR